MTKSLSGVTFVLLFLFTVSFVRAAEIREAKEYKIKAVFLYNFILFSNWPDSEIKNENIIIGILGVDVFSVSFTGIEGKLIKGKKKHLKIKRFGKFTGNENLRECDLLFMTNDEDKNHEKIIKSLKGAPVLTVSDTDGFLEKGGMINFLKTGKKVRWAMNDKAIKNSGIRVSSQLYRNAVKVIHVGEQDKL